jgi:hypothetical protein
MNQNRMGVEAEGSEGLAPWISPSKGADEARFKRVDAVRSKRTVVEVKQEGVDSLPPSLSIVDNGEDRNSVGNRSCRCTDIQKRHYSLHPGEMSDLRSDIGQL